jgi:hypothetical protein
LNVASASARVSQALEQETLQMEERLQQLKATMRQERSKSESIPYALIPIRIIAGHKVAYSSSFHFI